ncbi:MAG: lipocalin family protein [Desulfuromonadaceae bacterium]|nr:lipocalin family protein [Desulfuromonadaceae bacterium]MDD2856093.1 lipocalin family protein [Desulfuromonadaceae bacterium]
MFKLTIIVVTAVLIVSKLAADCYAASATPVLQTAAKVDIARYMGLWHEIARLEHRFQKNCVGSMAKYTLRSDGEIDVVNSCINENNGKRTEAKGVAWSVDPVDNSRLKVSFFWPFRGDYWIVELGEKYDYAVVGSPNRKYLWILSREPEMSESLYDVIVSRLRSQGFPVDALVRRPLGKTVSGDGSITN